MKSKVLTTREFPAALSKNARCTVDTRESSTAPRSVGLDVEQATRRIGLHCGNRSFRAGATARFSETWKMTACACSPASSDAMRVQLHQCRHHRVHVADRHLEDGG